MSHSDDNTEDGDIFHAVIQSNSQVTEIQPSEYWLSDHDDGNAVYMDLNIFHIQTPSSEFFLILYFIHL